MRGGGVSMQHVVVWSFLAQQALGAGGGGCTNYTAVSANNNANGTVVVATLLILFGIGVEKGKHRLFHVIPKSLLPILNALFAELTLLGIIGLALMFLEQSTLLGVTSEAVFAGNPGHLVHIFHDVHMMLFLVMVLFLVQVFTLVFISFRIGQNWVKYEILAQDKSFMVSQYDHEKYHCCRSSKDAITRHTLNFASLRSRFINPDPEDKIEYAPIKNKHGRNGHIETVLNAENSAEYRKVLTVYAFKSDSPVRIKKSWGNSEGKIGDWMIVGEEGDVYVCNNQLFQDTYERVENKINQYRKKSTVFARKFTVPFCAVTVKGPNVTRQNGPPGSYLVQADIESKALELAADPPVSPREDDKKEGQTKEEQSDAGALQKRGYSRKSIMRLKQYEQYVLSEAEFKKMYEPVDEKAKENKNALRPDFDFSMYLNNLLGHSLAEIVEVRIPTWFAMWSILLVIWAIFLAVQDSTTTTYILLVFGYVLVFICIAIRIKMTRIRKALTSTTIHESATRFSIARKSTMLSLSTGPGHKRGRSARVEPSGSHLIDLSSDTLTNGDEGGSASGSIEPSTPNTQAAREEAATVALMSAVMPPENLEVHGPPPYLGTKLRKRGRGCIGRMMGRPATKHEQLFWLDQHGVHFMYFLIQTVLMSSGLYMGAYFMSWSQLLCPDATMCSATATITLIPVFSVLVLLPYVIRDLVVCTSVEMMRKPHVIADVVRSQSIVRSLRALRLLTAMVLTAENTKSAWGKVNSAGASPQSPRGGAARVYGKGALYTKRKAELMEAFALFDRDGHGGITKENMREMLEFLGMTDSPHQVEVIKNIMASIDVDGDESITFNEFFDWVACTEQSAESRSHELTKAIFSNIDHDGNGSISTDELRAALSALGGVLSYGDVQQIVKEADKDGDGTIDMHEFEGLMKTAFRGSSDIHAL